MTLPVLETVSTNGANCTPSSVVFLSYCLYFALYFVCVWECVRKHVCEGGKREKKREGFYASDKVVSVLYYTTINLLFLLFFELSQESFLS